MVLFKLCFCLFYLADDKNSYAVDRNDACLRNYVHLRFLHMILYLVVAFRIAIRKTNCYLLSAKFLACIHEVISNFFYSLYWIDVEWSETNSKRLQRTRQRCNLSTLNTAHCSPINIIIITHLEI